MEVLLTSSIRMRMKFEMPFCVTGKEILHFFNAGLCQNSILATNHYIRILLFLALFLNF